MEEKKISIIVPIYNTKEYLDECMISLTNQTYSNIEIVIVDDGSTDGSEEVYNKYAKNDARIKVIRQKNMGVAKARKNAMAYVTGEYLAFVDSDDFIELDYYEKVVAVAEDFDLVTYGYYMDYGKDIKCYDVISKGEYKTEAEMQNLIANMIYYKDTLDMGLTGYIWNKLFRVDIAKNVFEEINEDVFISEDADFLYRYILKSKSVLITDICGYHYRVRSNSAVHSVNEKYLININTLYLSLKEVFEKSQYKESLIPQLQRWTAIMLSESTRIMGFGEHAQLINYIFPFINELKGKSIILYGAGAVGKCYYRQIKRFNQSESVMWVDSNWRKYRESIYDVVSPEEMVNKSFDFVIIAVKYKKLADDIRSKLEDSGIASDKILWKEPIRMVL